MVSYLQWVGTTGPEGVSSMGKPAQATQASVDQLAAQVAALTSALAALTHDLGWGYALAGKAAPAKGRKASKSKAKQARAAVRDANVAAGRMSTARYGCEADECKFGSYNAEPAKRHTLKDGHKAVELA